MDTDSPELDEAINDCRNNLIRLFPGAPGAAAAMVGHLAREYASFCVHMQKLVRGRNRRTYRITREYVKWLDDHVATLPSQIDCWDAEVVDQARSLLRPFETDVAVAILNDLFHTFYGTWEENAIGGRG